MTSSTSSPPTGDETSVKRADDVDLVWLESLAMPEEEE